MKHIKLAAFIIFIVGVVGCSSIIKSDNNIQFESRNWTSQMQKLSSMYEKALAFVLSDEYFRLVKEDDFRRKLGEFVKTTLSIKKTKTMAGGHKTIEFKAQDLANQYSYAYKALVDGDATAMREAVISSANKCMQCHNFAGKKQKLAKLNWNADLTQFSAMTRAQYYLIVQNYDKALFELTKVLNNKPLMRQDPHKWTLAAKMALGISVVVKHDTQLSINIVNRFLSVNGVPESLRQVAMNWRESIKKWHDEDVASEKTALRVTRGQALNKANEMHKLANDFGAFPHQDAGLIYLLRGLRSVQPVTTGKIKDTLYGEALYTAGLISQQLGEANLWIHHENYFASCTQLKPNTSLAKKCFVKYEASVLQRYFANEQNKMLPPYVKKELNNLKRFTSKENWESLMPWGL